MKISLKTLFALGILLSTLETNAQAVWVKEGKPTARIIAEDNQTDIRAAELLQDFVQRITHATLPVKKGISPRAGDIVIGKGHTAGLTEDGFRLQTSSDGTLYISSGGDKGSIYGVVTLLEQYLGVSCYAAHAYTIPQSASLGIPSINHAESPAFRYRQSQGYSLYEDPVYRLWFRLEEPKDAFVDGYWVHTFQRLLPASEYGTSHPEYFSMIHGVRRPGNASQLCLSNPAVLELVAQRIDSIFKANPDMRMISVSQNDGNDTYCTCPSCRTIDEEEGGPTGSIIRFVNKLAMRFPDKEFSTLAYQYTMQPSTKTRPLPNVNIMLCNIDCRREVPLTDNASGSKFIKALNGWSAISNNLFIWDYGINFDNYLVPFPNFPIMQDNIRLFKKNHATMLFSQIAGTRGGNFSEMRTYMASKLMWNPEYDADSLMQRFMEGYYGAAAPYIYQYEKLLEGALLGSGADLWIYDTATSHQAGMLNAKCRKRYERLFDWAEAAVANDKERLTHVQHERLSLQYSDLEIARTETGHTVADLKKRLEFFAERATSLGNPMLNERNNTVSDYCKTYAKRYFPGTHPNLAKGASITWITPPAEPYRSTAEKALTDEYLAGDSSKEPGWIGWQGDDGCFIIDMGQIKKVSSVCCDFIHQTGQWSMLPKKVTCHYSTDGKTYLPLGEHVIAEERRFQTLYYEARCAPSASVHARYIKVEIENQKVCPGWSFGAGHPAWFFSDEVTVE